MSCCWECKMVQPLWGKGLARSYKVKHLLTIYTPAILHLHVCPREMKMYVYTNTYTNGHSSNYRMNVCAPHPKHFMLKSNPQCEGI